MKYYKLFSPILLLTSVIGIALSPHGVRAEEEREEFIIRDKEKLNKPFKIQAEKINILADEIGSVYKLSANDVSEYHLSPGAKPEQATRLIAELEKVRTEQEKHNTEYRAMDVEINILSSAINNVEGLLRNTYNEITENEYFQKENKEERIVELNNRMLRLKSRLSKLSGQKSQLEISKSIHLTRHNLLYSQGRALEGEIERIFRQSLQDGNTEVEEREELENFVLATEAWTGTFDLVGEIHDLAEDDDRLRIFALQRLEDVVHDPDEHMEYLVEIIMETDEEGDPVHRAAWIMLAQISGETGHEDISKEIYLSFIIHNETPDKKELQEWLKESHEEDEEKE